jgi:pimeloyl-ACP methyl ester carboxylesterase
MADAPALLLHSSGLSGRQFRQLAVALGERDVRVVVPDLNGQGSSPPWPEPRPFSFRQDVADVVSLLDREGRMHVVGHSYGGFVALQSALARPSAVASLAVYDPVAFGALDRARDADVFAEVGSRGLGWGPEASDRERWLTAFVDYWGGAGAWGALREDARAEFRRVAWVVREGVRTLMEDTTPAVDYRVVGAPALLLTGEASPAAARRVIERLAEALPHARTVTIPGAGHMGPLTHAEAVNAAVVGAIAPG